MNRMRLLIRITFVLIPLVTSFAFPSSPSFPEQPPNLNREDKQVEGSDQTIPQIMPADPSDESIPKLKFGDTLRFEELGPIILNSDGTTRRIANWEEMTDREREVAWRRIKKRNEERRKFLEDEQQQQLSRSEEEL